MNFLDYWKTFDGALAENRVSRHIIFASLALNLVLGAGLFFKKDAVILMPPNLSKEAKISASYADAGLLEAWGSYVVSMMANVTPRTAEYVSKNLGKHISPSAYGDFMAQVSEQAKRIKDESITINFIPASVFYAQEIDAVVVSGEYVIRGSRANERRSVKTYEIEMEVSNFNVLVRNIKAYDGAWQPPKK